MKNHKKDEYLYSMEYLHSLTSEELLELMQEHGYEHGYEDYEQEELVEVLSTIAL